MARYPASSISGRKPDIDIIRQDIWQFNVISGWTWISFQSWIFRISDPVHNVSYLGPPQLWFFASFQLTVCTSVLYLGQVPVYSTRYQCTVPGTSVQYQVPVYSTRYLCTVPVTIVQYQVPLYSTRYQCTLLGISVHYRIPVYSTRYQCTLQGTSVQYQVPVYICSSTLYDSLSLLL